MTGQPLAVINASVTDFCSRTNPVEMVHAIEPLVGLALHDAPEQDFGINQRYYLLRDQARVQEPGVQAELIALGASSVLAFTYHQGLENGRAVGEYVDTYRKLRKFGSSPSAHTKNALAQLVCQIDSSGDRTGAERLTKVCFDVGLVGTLNFVHISPRILVPAFKQYRSKS